MDFSFMVDNLEAVEVALSFLLNLMKKYHVPSEAYRFEVFRSFDTICDDLPDFRLGDGLSFRFKDGEYGAAIVLKLGKDTETNFQVGKPPADPSFVQTLVGVLNYKQPERPKIAVYEQRDWLLSTQEHSKYQPYLVWLSCFGGLEVEVIGKTDLRSNDPMECRFTLDWTDLPGHIILNNERDNPVETLEDILPVYKVGTGISYQFPDGEFGAGLVLATSTDGPNWRETLVGVLDYKSPQLPSEDVFTKRNWLKVTQEWRKDQPFLVWALGTPEDVDFREITLTTIDDSDPKFCNLSLNWSDIPEFVLLECKIETKNS
jgi:hypothetical protein